MEECSRKLPQNTDSFNDGIIDGISKNYDIRGDNHLKILIPSTIVGAILGKGGETISDIQLQTNAKIQVSKAKDVYPGTQDRICLISGRIRPGSISIKNAFSMIVEFLIKKSEDNKIQIKFLVPNHTAGMIIGKGGQTIQKLQDKSLATIQVSKKIEEVEERCVLVAGSPAVIKKACEEIVEIIVNDPLSGSCPKLSYNDEISQQNGNVMFTRRPSASSEDANVELPFSTQPIMQPGLSNGPRLQNFNMNLNFKSLSTAGNKIPEDVLHGMRSSLRASGYTDHAVSEITDALSVLTRYGILGLNFEFNSLNNNVRTAPVPEYRNGDVRMASHNDLGMGYVNNRLEVEHEEVHIADKHVGAILGPGGKCIAEIQRLTGAVIQISQKGEYAEGTNDRIVRIRGTPRAIGHAKDLIVIKIREADERRAGAGSRMT